MATLTRLIADDVVRACDCAGAQRVVDIGGGHGELLVAVLSAHASLHGIVYDLPHASEGAAIRLEQAGLGARSQVITGDFFTEVPAGADVYLLKSVLHNWDDEGCSTILRNCRHAMAATGRIVLIERVMPDRIQATSADRAVVRADLGMLIGLEGRERTLAEFGTLLACSGFGAARVTPTSLDFRVIESSPRPTTIVVRPPRG